MHLLLSAPSFTWWVRTNDLGAFSRYLVPRDQSNDEDRIARKQAYSPDDLLCGIVSGVASDAISASHFRPSLRPISARGRRSASVNRSRLGHRRARSTRFSARRYSIASLGCGPTSRHHGATRSAPLSPAVATSRDREPRARRPRSSHGRSEPRSRERTGSEERAHEAQYPRAPSQKLVGEISLLRCVVRSRSKKSVS
jgi:hypothetical protein